MLTEIQSVILTCLLGPEDQAAFSRERDRLRYHALSPEAKERRLENDKVNAKKFRDENPEESRRRVKISNERARKEDPERFRGYDRKRRLPGSEANRLRGKKQRVERPKETRQSILKCIRARRLIDPEFRVNRNLRSRISGALRRVLAKKGAASFTLLGCSVPELMVHLESLFRPGMTWENYGPVWHVDHIRPCDSFNLLDIGQQRLCFHWTNLQPLFAAENIAKGNKYVG